MATAQNRNVLIEENFDTYTAGQKLVQQSQAAGISYWTTWSTPHDDSQDPVISNQQSNSPSNSVNPQYGNDLVLLLGDVISGQYELSFNIYVPSDKKGDLVLLHHFTNITSDRAAKVYFNSHEENGVISHSTGEGVIQAGGLPSVTFNFTPNNWIQVRFDIDIDADQAQLRVAGQLFHTWQWSLNHDGGYYGANLSGIDFFPREEGDAFFVDDIVYSSAGDVYPAPSSLDTRADVEANVSLTWTGIAPAYNIYRNDELVAEGVAGSSYYDEQPGEGEFCYHVTSVYGETESAPSNTDCVNVVVVRAPENLTAVVQAGNVVLNWDPTGASFYKILRDGQLVGTSPNATTFTHTGYDGGSYCYTVRGVYGNWESANSNEACVGATGIDAAANARVSVYPNPGRDMVTVANGGEFARVEVVNILGQAVIDMPVCEATFDLDIAQLNKGLYIVRLSKDNVAKHIKFVKE